MKYPKFKSCSNGGCRSKKTVGMHTNGSCNFPRISTLKEKAALFWSSHDDAEVRRFGREVAALLEHIKHDEGT